MPALDGLRVVEAGLLVQGPQAAATMADWGAEVIKVELPGAGDQSRWLPLSPEDRRSAYFWGCNRGKRSITLDLRVAAGRSAFLRLVETADVVITNFKPGTMESWGLGYDSLAAVTPRIVFAAGSTFGSEGPDAQREGADLSAQAAGGLISTTGVDGGEPTPVGATIADHIASQNLLAGVLAALIARGRTGRGQKVETSLLGGQIWAQASELTALLLTGQVPGRANYGNALVPGLYTILPTADGWVAIVGVVGPARPAFFAAVGRAELAERYRRGVLTESEKREIWDELAPAFRGRTTAEWCAALSDFRVVPVRNYAEVLADPGARVNGYLADVPDETAGGTRPVILPPVRFGATPAEPRGEVPELGQHTEEVLLEIGYSWEEIEALRAEGAI